MPSGGPDNPRSNSITIHCATELSDPPDGRLAVRHGLGARHGALRPRVTRLQPRSSLQRRGSRRPGTQRRHARARRGPAASEFAAVLREARHVLRCGCRLVADFRRLGGLRGTSSAVRRPDRGTGTPGTCSVQSLESPANPTTNAGLAISRPFFIQHSPRLRSR